MIAARGVSHAFPGTGPVLRDISFEIGEGERVVVLGANGCGKTTLLRILAGLITPDAGEATWRGEIVPASRRMSPDFRRRFRADVGLVFQTAGAMLFHGTVRDEIAFGPRQLGLDDAADRTATWAERLGVTPLLDRDPHSLSPGEQKKVALAAVFAIEPSVLLLDEPTAGLDPRSVGELVDLLLDEPRTVISSTHNLSLAPELGERALVIAEDHRIIRDGDFASLAADRDALRAANLVHLHRHRHDGKEHRHWHGHEWD